jgi:hypothetical protein
MLWIMPEEKVVLNGDLPGMTFEEIISESDIIAKVKIEELVETYEVPGDHVTKFKAKVQKFYKNNANHDEYINFYFLGSPSRQYVQNPLLEVNKSYILYLTEKEVPQDDTIFNEQKILLLVNKGYGRFNIINDEVSPQLELNDDKIFKTQGKLKLNNFDKVLKEKIEKEKN